jgi:hypothetical protein
MRGMPSNFSKAMLAAAFLVATLMITASLSQSNSIGVFESQTDVGKVLHPGSASYDPEKEEYLISGSA